MLNLTRALENTVKITWVRSFHITLLVLPHEATDSRKQMCGV